jgi:hypothetical protein
MPKQKPKLERAQARARAEAQAPLEREAKHADPALLQFEQWMKLRGVEWDSALHIRACHQKGERPHYAVFAGDSLAVDKPVVTIPKVTCRVWANAARVDGQTRRQTLRPDGAGCRLHRKRA